MNLNLEEEVSLFTNRLQEISFSKSFSNAGLGANLLAEKNNNESIEYFFGASTRRKLLHHIEDNQVQHPCDDESVIFPPKDNIDLIINEKSSDMKDNKVNYLIENDAVAFPEKDNNELLMNDNNSIFHKEVFQEIELKKIPEKIPLGFDIPMILQTDEVINEKREKYHSKNIWKSNVFIIVFLVSSFISKIKKKSCIYMRKSLKNQHYNILNDKSYFPVITKKTIDQKTIELMRSQNYFLKAIKNHVY